MPDESFVIVNGSFSLINHKVIERVWSIGAIDADLIKKIDSVPHCIIEQNLNSDGMLVKGHNQLDVQKAIAKLEVVSKFTQQQQSFPIIRNFQSSEGEINT